MPPSKSLRVGPVRDRRPLSVQVYDRLIDALGAGLDPGDIVPTEVELAATLGVSRTVLREALRLLEEDGVIERADDPRRRRLAAPGGRPAAFSAPLEEMLRVGGPLEVRMARNERIASTRWSRELLGVGESDELLCRESVLLVGGEPVASALELMPTGDAALEWHLALLESGEVEGTLLAAIGSQFRSRCEPSLWRLGPASTVGTRTGFTGVPASRLASLTTVLSRQGRPVHLAKYLFPLDGPVLVVGRSADPYPEDL